MVDFSKRPGRVRLDLQEQKEPFLVWCKLQGVTPSDALRQMVLRVLGAAPQPEALPIPKDGSEAYPETDTGRRKIQHKINMTIDEWDEVEANAARQGMTRQRWLASLIRAALKKGAQFNDAETEALARSNLQLLAIGRNLNQMAKALNATRGDAAPYRVDLILELHDQIRAHVRHSAALIEANEQRWARAIK